MIDQKRVVKLIQKLRHLTVCVGNEGNLAVYKKIDLLYYAHKAWELVVLCEQSAETKSSSQNINLIEQEYKIVFNRWRKDVRWLNNPDRKACRSVL